MHTERLNVYNVSRCYRGIRECLSEGFGEILSSDEVTVQILLSKISDGHIIAVTVEGNSVVATATGIVEQKLIHGDDPDYTPSGATKVLHIEDVATRKDMRGNGYGAASIRELEEAAREEGCYKIILDASIDNYNRFYHRLGYRESEICLRKNIN